MSPVSWNWPSPSPADPNVDARNGGVSSAAAAVGANKGRTPQARVRARAPPTSRRRFSVIGLPPFRVAGVNRDPRAQGIGENTQLCACAEQEARRQRRVTAALTVSFFVVSLWLVTVTKRVRAALRGTPG